MGRFDIGDGHRCQGVKWLQVGGIGDARPSCGDVKRCKVVLDKGSRAVLCGHAVLGERVDGAVHFSWRQARGNKGETIVDRGETHECNACRDGDENSE